MNDTTGHWLRPIGWVRSSRSEPAGRAHGWNRETAAIELDSRQFDESSLHGLDAFSHIELIFLMDQVDLTQAVHARRPGDRDDRPEIGIFAQRYSLRPNRIGLTRSRILSVVANHIYVSGCDALDGTPVLDIKPWFDEYGPQGGTHQPAWSTELMHGYWQ